MSDPVVLLSTGDVVGPAGGVTDNSMVLFSGTSGKLIKGNNAVVTAAGLALLDDVDAAAQRTTLQLKTGAVTDKTTSATDTTVGSLTKVGDFGVGGMLDLRSTIFATGKPQDLYSKGFVKGFAEGGPSGLAIPGIVDVNYGVLEVNAQYSDHTGAGGIMRSFTRGDSGVVYTQTMVNATTWGVWREIALTDSPAFTGNPTAPTASVGTSTTQLATTAFVTTANNLKANIDSPAFTGVPSAPTAYPGTDTAQLANTAFVKAAIAAAPMLGVGQTWQDVKSSRSIGVTYTNTSGRPIQVSITLANGVQPISRTLSVGGVIMATEYKNTANDAPIQAIVPSGVTYRIDASAGASVNTWAELK